jgi:chromosome partitioning protein
VHGTVLMDCRVIVIANNKGGTGKSTTAVNLATGLSLAKGFRVLLIDTDPQANASMAMGIDVEAISYSLRDVLVSPPTDSESVLWDKGDQLTIVPAHPRLHTIEAELLTSPGGRFRLKRWVESQQHVFDFIIIDTPPTIGILSQMALIAGTEVLIPVDVGFFSLQGIRQLLEEIEEIRDHYNTELTVTGIVLNKYDARTILSKQVHELLRKRFPEKTFQTVIRISIDLVRAQINRKSIFAYAPASTGAQDYARLMEELLGNVIAFEQQRRIRHGQQGRPNAPSA